jgi:streptomycin 6-kinase
MYHPPDAPFIARMHRMYGDLGHQWCTQLPMHVTQLAHQWDLHLGTTFELSFNYVCEATRRSDGRPVVLKTGVPTPEFMGELTMHQHYAGRGAVACLETDADKYAVLLARVYPGTRLRDVIHDDLEATTVVAGLIRDSLFHAPDTLPIPSIYDWADDVFPHARNVCATRHDLLAMHHIERAHAIFRDHPPLAPMFALHGDLHHDNILRTPTGWCIIDPQGVRGNAAYECSCFLRNPQPWLSEQTDLVSITMARIAIMSRILHIPAADIAMWNYAAMVVSAWWSFQANQAINAAELSLIEAFYTVWNKYCIPID